MLLKKFEIFQKDFAEEFRVKFSETEKFICVKGKFRTLRKIILSNFSKEDAFEKFEKKNFSIKNFAEAKSFWKQKIYSSGLNFLETENLFVKFSVKRPEEFRTRIEGKS